MNKHAYIFLLFLSVIFPIYVHANIEISEIMYDLTAPPSDSDADREWIELHNTGTESVNLSKWYLYDSSHHVLHPDPNGGLSDIPAGGYSVVVQDITKFKIDWPQYSGLLFYASFPSLANENDTIHLKDNNTKDGAIADSVSYDSSMGASEDGNSLQKINNSWVPAVPTPGALNQASTTTSTTNTNQTTTTISGGSSSASMSFQKIIKPKESLVPKIRTEILATAMVIAGIDIPVEAHATGLEGGTLLVGKFVWNFGDGTPVVVRTTAEPFMHRYKYPGEYLMTLNFMEYPYRIKPDATDRLIVTVTSGDIFINRIGDSIDPFVELGNKSKYEIDLSNWILRSSGEQFVIPQGTIILPGKKLVIGGETNRFTSALFQYVELLEPSGVLATAFPIAPPTRIITPHVVNSSVSYHSKEDTLPINLTTIDESQSANVQSADVTVGVPILVLIGLIIAGSISATLFIKKTAPGVDAVSENDIKIIE